jgi:hypothetical protein
VIEAFCLISTFNRVLNQGYGLILLDFTLPIDKKAEYNCTPWRSPYGGKTNQELELCHDQGVSNDELPTFWYNNLARPSEHGICTNAERILSLTSRHKEM